MREPKNCERAELKVEEIYSLAEGEVNSGRGLVDAAELRSAGRVDTRPYVFIGWISLPPVLAT
jgi:hypothetical protein